jgi:hypothetical protein
MKKEVREDDWFISNYYIKWKTDQFVKIDKVLQNSLKKLFFFIFTTSWIWFGDQFWYQVVLAYIRSQLRETLKYFVVPSFLKFMEVIMIEITLYIDLKTFNISLCGVADRGQYIKTIRLRSDSFYLKTILFLFYWYKILIMKLQSFDLDWMIFFFNKKFFFFDWMILNLLICDFTIKDNPSKKE